MIRTYVMMVKININRFLNNYVKRKGHEDRDYYNESIVILNL